MTSFTTDGPSAAKTPKLEECPKVPHTKHSRKQTLIQDTREEFVLVEESSFSSPLGSSSQDSTSSSEDNSVECAAYKAIQALSHLASQQHEVDPQTSEKITILQVDNLKKDEDNIDQGDHVIQILNNASSPCLSSVMNPVDDREECANATAHLMQENIKNDIQYVLMHDVTDDPEELRRQLEQLQYAAQMEQQELSLNLSQSSDDNMEWMSPLLHNTHLPQSPLMHGTSLLSGPRICAFPPPVPPSPTPATSTSTHTIVHVQAPNSTGSMALQVHGLPPSIEGYTGTPHPQITGRTVLPSRPRHAAHTLQQQFANSRQSRRKSYVGGSPSPHASSFSNVTLNSSGSEENRSSDSSSSFKSSQAAYDMPSARTPYNTPMGQPQASSTPMVPTAAQIQEALNRAKGESQPKKCGRRSTSPLETIDMNAIQDYNQRYPSRASSSSSIEDGDTLAGRIQHNAKERARRARIKLACDVMRDVIPGMTGRTDKATVFEFAVEYIRHLKSIVGCRYDREFLKNATPLLSPDMDEC